MASRPKNDEIDPLVKQFQALQEQTNALASGRQNFLSRLNENKMVSEVRVARDAQRTHPARPLYGGSPRLSLTHALTRSLSPPRTLHSCSMYAICLRTGARAVRRRRNSVQIDWSGAGEAGC
mgnify:CR=1 FL=1|jgi:hypothetical protein